MVGKGTGGMYSVCISPIATVASGSKQVADGCQDEHSTAEYNRQRGAPIVMLQDITFLFLSLVPRNYSVAHC